MTSKLKNVFWVMLAGIALYWAGTTLVGTVLSGPLDPPAAPAETQKTQITSLPFTITSSGSYILMSDLTCASCAGSGDHGITIDADNVDIDLNGFALIGPGSGSGSGSGIGFADRYHDIAIKNGTVRDWAGAGIALGSATFNHRLSDLRAEGNGGPGFILTGNSLLSDCVSLLNGSHGIDVTGSGSIVKNCAASSNGGHGIEVVFNATVVDCSATFNTLSGINVADDDNRIEGCVAVGNGADGIAIAGSRNRVEDCVANENDSNGVLLSGDANHIGGCTMSANVAGGIELGGDDNYILNNLFDANARGIHVAAFSSGGNRIEGNQFTNNSVRGLDVDVGGNLIIKNSASGNVQFDYFIAAGNTVGPILGVADPIASTNPWANFSH